MKTAGRNRPDTIFVRHSGIEIKFVFSRWMPFKGTVHKLLVWMIDHMTFVSIYDDDTPADVTMIWKHTMQDTYETVKNKIIISEGSK